MDHLFMEVQLLRHVTNPLIHSPQFRQVVAQMQFERLTGGRHAATLKKAYEVIASRAVSKPPKFVLLNRTHTFGIRLAAGRRLAHIFRKLFHREGHLIHSE
jgi:hypothetical protein